MDKQKYIYLIEKNLLNRDNKIIKRLKVGKTKKRFQESRKISYDSNCSPEDISLVKVIKAPEILENMFHIRFNSFRIIKKDTGRKSEWMDRKDFIKEAFLSDNVFEETCNLLWNNKEEYLSGKNNLFVKKKIFRYLKEREKIKENNLYINISKSKSSTKSMRFILKNEFKNELELMKIDYENCDFS